MDQTGTTDRKLTDAEEARLENLRDLRDRLESEGYRMEALTVSIGEANMKALIYGFVFILPLALAFAWANGGFELPEPGGVFLIVAAFLVLIPVHEGIHGLTWAAAAPRHFKDIQFGFIKEALTPYCTCLAPMGRGSYVAGALMPFLVLGLLPCFLGIALNSMVVFAVGALMILGAGGDLTIVVQLLKHRRSGTQMLCVDHPTECGLVVFER